MARPPIVKVTWIDTVIITEWKEIGEVLDEQLPDVVTIGFLLDKSMHTITVAQSLSEAECSEVLIIPISIVKEIVELVEIDEGSNDSNIQGQICGPLER